MFGYILVSTENILLISICPMLKTNGKLNIWLLVLYLQIYLKITLRVQKYGGCLLNCTKIQWIALCWKLQQSTL